MKNLQRSIPKLNLSESENQLYANISHAKRIQNALFQTLNLDDSKFEDQFIIDLPKDQVGGDFYLLRKIQSKTVVLLGDCTGHGVSGALMTALCISIVSEMLDTYKTLSPSMVLDKVQVKLNQLFAANDKSINDGMDSTLMFIDDKTLTIRYATIGQSFHLISDNISQTFKGGRNDFGTMKIERRDQTLKYEKGAMVYLLSDGLKDQFGGINGKKLGTKRVHELFEEIYSLNCKEQSESVHQNLSGWKSGEAQTDDIMVMGIRL